jgi:hypothetical protein
MEVGHTCPTWAADQAQENFWRPHVGQVCSTYGHIPAHDTFGRLFGLSLSKRSLDSYAVKKAAQSAGY